MLRSPGRWSFLAPLLCGVLCALVVASRVHSSDRDDNQPLARAKVEDQKAAAGPASLVLPPAKPVLVLDLPLARKLALEKQPAVAAAQASLLAAQTKVKALENLGTVATLTRHDLCVRKEQAALGVLIAESRLRRAEIETLYSVTRCYWTVVYAQSQLRQVNRSLEETESKKRNLRTIREPLSRFRRERGEDRWVLDYYESLVKVLEGRREEARIGIQRGLAALREAIGVEDCLACLDQDLPEIPTPAECCQIVELALQHRPEIAQARLLAEVFGLEVKAQDLANNPRSQTFAAGSDLHSAPIPTADFGEQYRPGALAPEMPTTLYGPRCLRVEQAQALHQRSLAVLAKVHGLIRLEAENTFLLWLEARTKFPIYEETAVLAEKAAQSALEQLPKEESKTTIASMLDALLRQATHRQQANQARFHYVLQSAALERVTGGSFCPVYVPPVAKEEPAENKKE